MNFLLKDKVQVNTQAITEISSNKKLLEDRISIVKEYLLEIQNSNEKLIEEKQAVIIETNEQIQKLDDEYWKHENKRKELDDSLFDEETVSKKMNKLGQLRHQIEANLNILNKEVGFFHKYDNCPTCKQQIDETFKNETITTKEIEIKNIYEGLEKLSKEYEKTNARLNELIEIHGEINSKKLEISRVKTKISSLIEYRETLKKEIKNIDQKTVEKQDNKIPDLEKELNDLEINYNERLEDRNVFSVASALLKDSGIKSKIIKQYIPIINKLINKYLSAMEFMCQFELDEEFNETIKSRYRDVFSYSSFSEGEKMRINLAILFAWRAIAKLRNSVNTNILIMDEVFDSSLDSNGTEEFLKIINSLTSDTNTFIISHKTDQLYDKFEKVVRFEKQKNFSRIAS